jgi:pyridinium-3,5-biscarboxylic acid mononucleotide synthase
MAAGATGGGAYERLLQSLLQDVRDGGRTVEEAVASLRDLPFSDLGFARVDHHRELRGPLPEVVYAPGKTPAQLGEIVDRLLEQNVGTVLVTRCDEVQRDVVRDAADAAGLAVAEARAAGAVAIPRSVPPSHGTVVVAAAGTADLPVADEAALTASVCGVTVERLTDVGVAGLHRLLEARAVLEAADAVVVVAGMEGALPSVVGGLVARPVIACPTSVGYGATFGGLTALLAMLSSCALGVSCVNVDDGVGAGYVGALIARGRVA